jgi:prephenate dehydrogenase
MSPENHDTAFAAVSHLPHLLAFAFVNAVSRQPASPELFSLAGSGFRDFSRIAGGEPTMWRDILLANQDELTKQLQHFRQALEAMEYAMKSGNAEALEGLIRAASTARSACCARPG